eukprot:CAMPEP_0167746896 /NCGR_PEP_ID=MMETSP0110_2-20121227/3970_1 /TAXON_ID=629695 /ORGANISM="Gymnochlora sp., Strain CCMP2014" /LENGTH=316 /DNA_ID=CAMNT_0007631717 /DNA_START=54 /DNA_END=1004 /DNA_ORIENTATION=+
MNKRAKNIICTGHSRPIPQIEFKDTKEDGLFLISSCLDNRPMLRDGNSGDWIGSFIGHNGAVWCTRLNSSATNAITASADFSANYWCALTGQKLHTFSHNHIVRAAAFSYDDSKILTAGFEGKIRQYDIAKIGSEPLEYHDKGAKIEYLLTSSLDQQLLASSDNSSGVKIWDSRTMTVVRNLETDGVVTDMCASLDGSLICATAGGNAYFWDAKTFDIVNTIKTNRKLMSVAVDSERNRMVLGSEELWVRLYDFKSGKEVGCNKGHHGPVGSLAFAPSGAFASGSVDGTIRIWQWEEKQGKISGEGSAEVTNTSEA